jgi:hypothetical protein
MVLHTSNGSGGDDFEEPELPDEPLCDESEFAALIGEEVNVSAPKVFAVVQEYGERADYHVAAWGMSFDDRAEVVSVDRRMRMSFRSLDRVLRSFCWGPNITARLVWAAQP